MCVAMSPDSKPPQCTPDKHPFSPMCSNVLHEPCAPYAVQLKVTFLDRYSEVKVIISDAWFKMARIYEIQIQMDPSFILPLHVYLIFSGVCYIANDLDTCKHG